jgi:hypothetical protein
VSAGPSSAIVGDVPASTRLSIVHHALAEIKERLADLPRTRETDALQAIANRYATEVARWEINPPDEAGRSTLLKRILDLDVEVIRASGGRRAAAPRKG